jgi:hypothetical protein
MRTSATNALPLDIGWQAFHSAVLGIANSCALPREFVRIANIAGQSIRSS